MMKKYYAVRTVQVRVYSPPVSDEIIAMNIPDGLEDIAALHDAVLAPFDAPNFKTARRMAHDWLFSMSEKTLAELAQLRADLQAAQDERDEAKAWHISLNAMIDRKNATIAEQARQLDEARKLEVAIRAVHDIEIELTACPVCNYPPISCECAYTEVRTWLAANPAPEAEPQP